ncbi:Hypothetical predicted protein [Olea europaea subsp. europaea]|uniref:Uncharacterized protein n=1 Tax=Olea europaea subsp. europaea TaxID=158383 RepID=A0A8S0RK65_OLEEU|nr:Hypothetical predicted protein [Olea europaea subsp. europaea]
MPDGREYHVHMSRYSQWVSRHIDREANAASGICNVDWTVQASLMNHSLAWTAEVDSSFELSPLLSVVVGFGCNVRGGMKMLKHGPVSVPAL